MEVLEPGSEKEVWISFESESAFVSVKTGDLLSTAGWQIAGVGSAKLRVVRVEHFIVQASDGRGLAHQTVRVFTERV